ncbi:hypothetical protein ScPMuIL_002810 [Solemya velum]
MKGTSASSNKVGSVTDIEKAQNGSQAKLMMEAEDNQDSPSVPMVILKLIVCTITGMVFGISMEKARVFEPQAIRQQMVFENFIMLKMFLAAVAAGQLCLALLSVLPWAKGRFQTASEEYAKCFSDKSILTSAIGAFVLGCGMTLAGTCPGMVLIQVGTWTANAIFTFLGALIGALTYGMLAPHLAKFTSPRKAFEKQQVYTKFNIPFFALALPMALLLCVVIFLIEYFHGWETDLFGRSNDRGHNFMQKLAWPPYCAGALVGLMQIPIVLTVQDTLGGSTSYVTIVSQWVVTKRLKELFPYLAKKRWGVGNWWQVFYVVGGVFGGTISAAASGTLMSVPGPTLPAALLGGVLILWGSRFAAGCTSGHGLSGMGVLAWLSFVAVPFMFGGAIVTAFSMRATGALTDYVTTTGAV